MVLYFSFYFYITIIAPSFTLFGLKKYCGDCAVEYASYEKL